MPILFLCGNKVCRLPSPPDLCQGISRILFCKKFAEKILLDNNVVLTMGGAYRGKYG
jgi:hypothetical protein